VAARRLDRQSAPGAAVGSRRDEHRVEGLRAARRREQLARTAGGRRVELVELLCDAAMANTSANVHLRPRPSFEHAPPGAGQRGWPARRGSDTPRVVVVVGLGHHDDEAQVDTVALRCR
jgi:hypothetical protein